VDGFAMVPIRFEAFANIFSKIARAVLEPTAIC